MLAWADAVTTYTLFGSGVMLVVAVFASADRRLLRTGSAALLGAGTLFWAIVLGNNVALLFL